MCDEMVARPVPAECEPTVQAEDDADRPHKVDGTHTVQGTVQTSRPTNSPEARIDAISPEGPQLPSTIGPASSLNEFEPRSTSPRG